VPIRGGALAELVENADRPRFEQKAGKFGVA